MSYKVEITAASLTELAGKVLALAATMQTTAVVDPVMAEVKAATKPRKAKAEITGEEVAEKPVGEPAADAAETASFESDTATAPQEASESAETSTSTDASAENSASASDGPALDFDKDVAPVVLNAVKVKGKPWVQEVLAQFGVERASQVASEQLPELVAALAEVAA